MVVSFRTNLFSTSLLMAAGLSLSACASLPEASSTMRLAQGVAPPSAFLDFCRRQPGDCSASEPERVREIAAQELAERKLAEAQLRPGALSSRSATASVSSVAARESVSWAQAFEEARRRRELAALTIAPASYSLRFDAVRSPSAAPSPDPVQTEWRQASAAGLRLSLDVSGRVTPASTEPPGAALAAQDVPRAAGSEIRGLVVYPNTPAPDLTPKLWSAITRVNGTVNRAITQRKDQETYGVEEFWATPLAAGLTYGDCEDYVLEKRRALLAEGVPAHALSIAVVRTSWGESHAVLLVSTSQGDYVLDNLNPWVLPWEKANLVWLERQVAGAAFNWARVHTGMTFAKLDQSLSNP